MIGLGGVSVWGQGLGDHSERLEEQCLQGGPLSTGASPPFEQVSTSQLGLFLCLSQALASSWQCSGGGGSLSHLLDCSLVGHFQGFFSASAKSSSKPHPGVGGVSWEQSHRLTLATGVAGPLGDEGVSLVFLDVKQ